MVLLPKWSPILWLDLREDSLIEATTSPSDTPITQKTPSTNTKVKDLPDGAVAISVFEQSNWPSWRRQFWKKWKTQTATGHIFATCRLWSKYYKFFLFVMSISLPILSFKPG